MRSRRSFFGSLVGVAPLLFLPKLIVPTFKQTLKHGRSWVVESETYVYDIRDFGGKWQFVSAEAFQNYPIYFKKIAPPIWTPES